MNESVLHIDFKFYRRNYEKGLLKWNAMKKHLICYNCSVNCK